MNCLSVRPETISASRSEKRTGFHIYAPSFATGNDGDDECNQFMKGKLADSGEIFRIEFSFRVDLFRYEIKKFGSDIDRLA